MGRYQMGKSASKDIGFMDENGNWTETAEGYGICSIQNFYDNSEVQDMAFDIYVDVQKSYIKYFELDQYIGQEMKWSNYYRIGVGSSSSSCWDWRFDSCVREERSDV